MPKLLKTILLISIFVLIISFGALWYKNYANVCRRTLHYSIGTNDERFGLSQEDFLSAIQEAEKIWEEPMGLNLFQYSFGAMFKVNLVFDQRQAETISRQNFESDLSSVESAYSDLTDQHKQLATLYQSRLNDYNQSYGNYNAKVSSYNLKIAFYKNKKISKSEYDTLEKERLALNSMVEQLNDDRDYLSKMVDKLNELAIKINDQANKYNIEAAIYMDQFKNDSEFQQAIYDGRQINVYQYRTKDDLVAALAHEFGHSLGLEHLDNPKALMYYLSFGVTSDKLKLNEDDISALKAVCGI